MYKKRSYKVKLQDVYEYSKDNITTIDCIVKFSSIKTQYKFFERYIECNSFDLATSDDVQKRCRLGDCEAYGYFYSIDPENIEKQHPKIKAHFRLLK